MAGGRSDGAGVVETLDVRTRRDWREWLEANHRSAPEIWLVFHKRHTGVDCLSYDESVEEAICFGWIDSTVNLLDEEDLATIVSAIEKTGAGSGPATPPKD